MLPWQYLVSLRNIDTVASFAKNGTGLLWSISSDKAKMMGTAYDFVNDDDKFYDVHEAQMINETDFMLIDDGNNRPGCSENDDTDDEVGCFTRASRYRVHQASMTVELIWQFEFSELASKGRKGHK